MPISVSAIVGFIALLGQVSLLGLLVVSAIEERRRQGAALLPAVIEGSVEKLRAVLMAALLALFGLLPMAISTGIGSETQRPFALVIVGGMVTTLAITLFVLPAVYFITAAERYSTPEELDESA
jgi:cobalt-zinc-cadmium resistance protein CzcA